MPFEKNHAVRRIAPNKLQISIKICYLDTMPIFRRFPGGQSITSNRKFHILPVILFAVIGIIYYFSHQQIVPVTGRKQLIQLSREQEASLGLQSYKQLLREENIITSGSELQMIKEVGKKIASVSDDPGFNWEFTLIDSEQANAFCLPGGKVAVYSGILPIVKNQDGLAVVMAHEIAHAIARHGSERMAHQQMAKIGQMALGVAVGDMDYEKQRMIMGVFGAGAQYGILLPFSRKHESEADYIGLMYMSKACFNPEEAPKLWERMAQYSKRSQRPPEFMSTHPNDETRINQFIEWMPKAKQLLQESCGSR